METTDQGSIAEISFFHISKPSLASGQYSCAISRGKRESVKNLLVFRRRGDKQRNRRFNGEAGKRTSSETYLILWA